MESVIGLEIHLQLKTQTKLFCSCRNIFGAEPNTHVCEVCLGMPGVLPVVNKKAIEYALLVAYALRCEKISDSCKFARKNYFYPDLPKAYQISQYEESLAWDGYVDIIEEGGVNSRIRIMRINLEEDAGKLIHFDDRSLVDFNRCGVPLVEIVTYPDITTPQQAYTFLSELKNIIEYLGVSDCNMEEGSLRVDANISLRGDNGELGSKVEIKNMNSFKELKAALTYEIDRQREEVKKGRVIVQQTRLWDPKSKQTKLMRKKEYAHDYRYFPEPDLIPIPLTESLKAAVASRLPLLPKQRLELFIKNYMLSDYEAEVLTRRQNIADFFEAAVKYGASPKFAAKLIMTEILGLLKEEKIDIQQAKVKPQHLASLQKLIDEGRINYNLAKDLLKMSFESGRDPAEVGIGQIVDISELEDVVEQVLQENQNVVAEYLNGKERAFHYLVGCVMKKTKGKANPQILTKIIQQKIKSNT